MAFSPKLNSFAMMTGNLLSSSKNAYSRWGGKSLSSTSGVHQSKLFPCAFHHFFLMEMELIDLGIGVYTRRNMGLWILDYVTDLINRRLDVFGVTLLAGGIVSLSPRVTRKNSRTRKKAVLVVTNIFEKMSVKFAFGIAVISRLKLFGLLHEDSEFRGGKPGGPKLIWTHRRSITRISLVGIGRCGWDIILLDIFHESMRVRNHVLWSSRQHREFAGVEELVLICLQQLCFLIEFPLTCYR
ncbi:hypothetical protein Tco_0890552 [Tanacetum coccineum]|uniref:Uncharacterized protein n=1 Tax=Tanacetum coccineum TaxID=301880 RepID=A0ABQ5C0S6_9ASTR